MKIEMNKKYETKAGEKVLIYSVAGGGDYSVHGAVDTVTGYRMCTWTHEGRIYEGEDSDSDLIELKEDWKILVEHFKNSKTPVLVFIGGNVHLCLGVEQGVIDEEKCNILIDLFDKDSFWITANCQNIKLATLEDCKKYILDK